MKDSLHNRITRCCWLTLVVWSSAVTAAEPKIRVTLADGSAMSGVLSVSHEPQRIQIRSDLFGRPMEIPTDRLLECRLKGPETETATPIEPGADSSKFAFLFDDKSQFVGHVVSRSDQALVLQTEQTGQVTLETDRLVSVVPHNEMPRQILSLANSRFRFRRETGWGFRDGSLGCEQPGAATVGALELPNQFRIRLQVRCDGQADFELSLGDRSVDGAGQGGQRNDRRGGSLSRLPSERFVTRLEWLGRSVSLVRSNASVSDAAVFDVGDDKGALEVDLFFDQQVGRFLAFGDGVLLGDVSLADEEPVLRRALTMISRGDPVHVDHLELFQWDGRVPQSRRLPVRFTLLGDGTLLNQIADRWERDRFQVGGKWYSVNDLARMEFGAAMRADPGCEITLVDGSRLRGRLDGRGEAGRIRILDARGNYFSVDPSRVVRLVGEQESKEMPTVGADELVAEGVRLRGHLVGGADPAVPLGWRTVIGENNLGIIAIQGVEIQFAPRPNETAESPAAGFVELRRGDRLPGELVMMDADGVRFRGDVSGEVLVPVEEVSRIRLGRPGKLDDADLDLLLSLPRRMKDSPPTHMLVSSSGDLLRGRLTSIDGQEARLEIRGKTRVIERAKISEVVWLGQKTAPSAECRYVVATRDGARLGLGTAKLQAAELRGTHEVFGECRLPTQTLTTLTFGPRQDSQRERWELVPVKEPRSFE